MTTVKKLLVTFVVELEFQSLEDLVASSGGYIQEMEDRLNESGYVLEKSTNIRDLYTERLLPPAKVKR